MATTPLSSNLKGYVNLKFLGNKYGYFNIGIFPYLCTDTIIGHDVIKQHNLVVVHFGGTKPPLSIYLTEANVSSSQLFGNLSPECKPIVTK